MADSDRQIDKQWDHNLREKGEKRKKRNKTELTLWSGSLVVFAARSLMADSDRQTDKRGDQNVREKGEERKGKFSIYMSFSF